MKPRPTPDWRPEEHAGGAQVQTAVKLQVPGALGRHAVAEGSKAVQRALA